jgi:hypothetical protein
MRPWARLLPAATSRPQPSARRAAQTAKAFLEDIKKQKQYSKLETVVNREILGKLDAFVKSMEQIPKG